MNGLIASLVSAALVAAGSAGLVLDGVPAVSFGATDNTEPLPVPLPPLPPTPLPENETLVDPSGNGTANETAPAETANETAEPEEETDRDSHCGTDRNESYTYHECGTAIHDSNVMVGPTSQGWSWAVPKDAPNVEVYFSANGQALGGALGCAAQGSNVRLVDGNGAVVAQADDREVVGLTGGLHLEFSSGERAPAPGTWHLEFQGCYAAGHYDVVVEADCREVTYEG